MNWRKYPCIVIEARCTFSSPTILAEILVNILAEILVNILAKILAKLLIKILPKILAKILARSWPRKNTREEKHFEP